MIFSNILKYGALFIYAKGFILRFSVLSRHNEILALASQSSLTSQYSLASQFSLATRYSWPLSIPWPPSIHWPPSIP